MYTMTNPNFASNPQPTEDIYRYAAGPEGSPCIDIVYKTSKDVVDVGRFAGERINDPLAQALGPIMIYTQAAAAGPDGRRETRAYALTSKYFLDLQTGQYVEINPHDPSQVQPVTVGAQWMSPTGRKTQFNVVFVARPDTREFMEDRQIDPDNERPAVQSPTAVGQQHLEHFLGKDAYFG